MFTPSCKSITNPRKSRVAKKHKKQTKHAQKHKKSQKTNKKPKKKSKKKKLKRANERTLFIGGLPLDITNEQLATYFGRFGSIKQVSVNKKNPEDELNLGYGFIEATDTRTLNRLLERSFYFIKDREVEVKPFLEKGKNRNIHLVDLQKRRLYVSGVPSYFEDTDLRDFFGQYGALDNAYILDENNSLPTTQEGFLLFKRAEDCQRISRLVREWKVFIDGHLIKGKKRKIKLSKQALRVLRRKGETEVISGSFEEESTVQIEGDQDFEGQTVLGKKDRQELEWVKKSKNCQNENKKPTFQAHVSSIEQRVPPLVKFTQEDFSEHTLNRVNNLKEKEERNKGQQDQSRSNVFSDGRKLNPKNQHFEDFSPGLSFPGSEGSGFVQHEAEEGQNTFTFSPLLINNQMESDLSIRQKKEVRGTQTAQERCFNPRVINSPDESYQRLKNPKTQELQLSQNNNKNHSELTQTAQMKHQVNQNHQNSRRRTLQTKINPQTIFDGINLNQKRHKFDQNIKRGLIHWNMEEDWAQLISKIRLQLQLEDSKIVSYYYRNAMSLLAESQHIKPTKSEYFAGRWTVSQRTQWSNLRINHPSYKSSHGF